MNLEIKPATTDQAQLIADILNDGTQFKRAHGDEGWGDFSLEGGLWIIQIGTMHVAYLDGEPVGTIALEWEDDGWEAFDPDAAYIHRLAVKQDYHGQHIGERMIAWSENQAKQKGCLFLRLDCSPTNQPLCKYYETQGFIKVAEHYFKDPDYLANLYQRPILY